MSSAATAKSIGATERGDRYPLILQGTDEPRQNGTHPWHRVFRTVVCLQVMMFAKNESFSRGVREAPHPAGLQMVGSQAIKSS